MASRLAWLDYSEHERRRALDVIDLFRENDTRDELGLGVIRDAFSDHYFPGTSTIQTRLRYFLFIPWILQDLEKKQTPGKQMKQSVRRHQGRLRDSLIAGDEEIGVIGYLAGISVSRLPSNVYWNGLRRWGILLFQGSEDEYHNSLDHHYSRQHLLPRTDEDEVVDRHVYWDPHLPVSPSDLFKNTTFELREAEAEYLIDRIKISAGRSLLCWLIEEGLGVKPTADFPWEHVGLDSLDGSMRAALEHGQNFSESMLGAALLYNLMLAEESGRDEVADVYKAKLGEWWYTLKMREAAFARWDRGVFWSFLQDIGTRVPILTHQFVDQWLNLISQPTRIENVLTSGAARQLLTSRERQLKGGRSRIGNTRALERWNGAAGTAQLDYRWKRPVRSFLTDLLSDSIGET